MPTNQFRRLREARGLTQAAVAQHLGLKDKSTVAKWEAGVALPSAEKLPKIAELYGCTVDELLGGETRERMA